jgi:general secretion pathway protein M
MIGAWVMRWRASSLGQRFAALELQQQRLVAGVALLLGVGLLYLVVWQPISVWSERAQDRYARELAVLDFLRTNETAARDAARNATPAGGDGSILTLVAESAAAAGVQLTRYQNEAGGGLSIVLQDQNFDAVLGWLATLERGQRVRIRQLSVDAQGNPGRVNARISII